MGQEAEMPHVPQKKDGTGMFPALQFGKTVKTLDNIQKCFSSAISHLSPCTPF